MADQNGVFTRPNNYTNDAAAGHGTDPVEFDAELNQVAAALNNRLPSDGSRAASADLPMNGHAMTGMRPGAAAGESVTFEQLQASGLNGAFAYCAGIVF